MKAAGDWDAAARLPVSDGSDPDDAMEHIRTASKKCPLSEKAGVAADMLGCILMTRKRHRGSSVPINE
jgi:hypothetical protein